MAVSPRWRGRRHGHTCSPPFAPGVDGIDYVALHVISATRVVVDMFPAQATSVAGLLSAPERLLPAMSAVGAWYAMTIAVDFPDGVSSKLWHLCKQAIWSNQGVVGYSFRAPAEREQRAVAQLGSALDWGSSGRRFKSCQPDR